MATRSRKAPLIPITSPAKAAGVKTARPKSARKKVAKTVIDEKPMLDPQEPADPATVTSEEPIVREPAAKAPEARELPAEPELPEAPPAAPPEPHYEVPTPVEPKNGTPMAQHPVTKTAPILTDKTQEILEEFQDTIKLPLIAYWTSTDGSICHNDVMAMAQVLQNKKFSSTSVALFLKSEGGNPEAALRLVHLLRSRFKKIVLYAPYSCASAATMVALGTNEIHMGPTSYLTPVDTSLKHSLSPVNSRNDMVSVSQDELSRILRLWNDQKIPGNPYPEVYKYLHPLVIGALDRVSSLSMRISMELLGFHMKNKALAKKISHQLNSSFPAHSYPITAREARALGLNIRDLGEKECDLLQRLHELYCQMTDPIVTDYDMENNHNHEICNIIEAEGKQVYYHVDKDWHYRKEERRWIVINDKSGWRRVTKKGDKWTPEVLAMR